MPDILRPIYIEKEEGVGSILSRIQKTSENKLALIFPPDSNIFRNVLEVEFLKKEVDKLKKEIVVITSQASQAELAKGMGIKTSEDIKKSDEADKFLEDFYSKKTDVSPKVESPLVKPKISDIVSNKSPVEKTTKIEVKPIEAKQDTEITPPEPTPVTEKLEEKKPEEDLMAAPRVEPISLTEEDFGRETESQKPEKSKKSLKLKLPKPSFGWLKKISKSKATKTPLKKIFVLLLLLAIAVFALVATFIFPRAEAIVRPAREKAQLNIDVLFSSDVKAVDFEDNIVPAQIFKLTKSASQEFNATKEEDIRKKAEGTITIYNAYSSEPQTLVKTTRFESPEGKVFRITETITVPGAKIQGGSIIPSSIDAGVIADEAGESYNIDPSDFTIPGFKGTDKYSGFYGKSSEKMSGGLIKKGLVVGEDDVKAAEATLKDQLLADAQEELKEELGTDLKLIEESLKAEVIESIPSPALGEPAERFTLTLKALAQVFAYKEENLGDLVEEKIALKVSDKRLTLPETRSLSFQFENVDFDTNEASFSLIVEEDVSWKIDEERLKEILAGKNEVEAREAIKLFSEIESTRVSLWPFWLRHIPQDFRKIEITIDY